MRRAAIALAVLLALALVGDRIAAGLAADAIAAKVQATTALPEEPEVTVRGFPFLTQALSGRYDRVDITARDVPARDTTLARLDTTLRGVQVPLSQALSGAVDSVPVESVEARALVPYDELARRSGARGLTVAPAEGDRVRVTGEVDVPGGTVAATAVSRVEVVDGVVVITAESFEVGDRADDAALNRALAGLLDLEVPVRGLPFGLQVSGVSVQPDGVRVVAEARDTVLSPA